MLSRHQCWRPASLLETNCRHELGYQFEVDTGSLQSTTARSSHDIEESSNPNERREVGQDVRSTVVATERTTTTDFEAERRNERVKGLVWQILGNKLRQAESISGSVVVETEIRGSQQMLIVTCYGPAVARAREIRKLLEKSNYRLTFLGYILTVKEKTQLGTDLSLLSGPWPWDDVSPRSIMPGDVPVASVSNTAPGQGNSPWTAREHEANRFANTPYWNSTSILVYCLLPPRPQLATNTLCGALVRMLTWEHQGESQLRTWTCGGVIYVNSVPYALTTAHPLILHSHDGRDGRGNAKPSVISDVFPAEHHLLPWKESNVKDAMQGRQTLGRVYKHAMSSGNHVPANYDWLLIDIAKDYRLPNFPANPNRDGSQGPHDMSSGSVSICTWRGS